MSNAEDHDCDEHLRHRGNVWEVDDPLYGNAVAKVFHEFYIFK